MIVLGALEAVDWVVSFEEDTPQRLIAGILPDLLVKGGDYKPEEIAGSKEVWANGGEVLVLNFEDGCSTTNIIKKIQLDKKANWKAVHRSRFVAGRSIDAVVFQPKVKEQG
ncbi:hypothetical protein MUTS15_62310 [Escherichia coli]|nr:hypothetical protein MUTS15_62310 [Escherichia coli]BDZ06118.1 hypothetical protein MUTS16_71910 [Escherichia coli]